MNQEFKEPDLTEADTKVCKRIVKSVICRVEKFEVRRSHNRAVEYSIAGTVAFFGLIPIVAYILKSSSQSGFGRYLSLMISDSSYVFTHWKEFILSAVSSLPLTGAIVIFLVLLIFLMSLRLTIRNSEYSNNMKKKLVTT